MKTNTTITIVRPPTPVAIVAETASVTTPSAPSRPRPVRADRQPDHSAEFRDELQRRYETPFHCYWEHEGLND